MTDSVISTIYDLVAAAHAGIQQNFSQIDPVVSVSHQMRSNDVPADVMTIDCLKSGKRIILIFHDLQPELVSYQFCRKDSDPHDEFETIALDQLSEQQLYDWMKITFSAAQK